MLQIVLKSYDYYEGKIDGKIGSVSKAALRSFQNKNGLIVDGILGPETCLRLLDRVNIRSNVIAPGFIETEMTGKLDEATVQSWRDAIPLKRGGTPEDIANTCVFLASDMSSYITGQTLSVDGGMLT